MGTKHSFFHQLKTFYAGNPAMTWAIGWVGVVPSLGSLTALRFLYSDPGFFDQFRFFVWEFILLYTLATTLFMGLALLPTTFLAILSGFVFGWVSLPFLVLGYMLATVIGYLIGKNLDRESLAFLLEHYPKAARLIADKKDDISQLVFFVRLSPVIPFALSNLLFSMLKVNLMTVVWMGLWGMLPRTLLAFTTGVLGESLLGALQESNSSEQLFIVVALLLISGWGIFRFFKRKR